MHHILTNRGFIYPRCLLNINILIIGPTCWSWWSKLIWRIEKGKNLKKERFKKRMMFTSDTMTQFETYVHNRSIRVFHSRISSYDEEIRQLWFIARTSAWMANCIDFILLCSDLFGLRFHSIRAINSFFLIAGTRFPLEYWTNSFLPPDEIVSMK